MIVVMAEFVGRCAMLVRSFPVRPRRADPHLQPRAAGELDQRVQAEQFRPALAQVRGRRARDAELFPEFCIAQVRVFEVRDDRLQQFLALAKVKPAIPVLCGRAGRGA